MRSRVRLWGTASAIALLITALTPVGFGVSQGAQPATLSPGSTGSTTGPVIVSPPAGLGLPVGQYVGVRYQLAGGRPAILELRADGIVLISQQVQPGQHVTHAWTPTRPGPHQLRVRALAPDGTLLDSAGLVVIGLLVGSRVQVP